MNVSLGRIVLYVRDVEALSAFYRRSFGLAVVESIAGEWCVLKAGPCEIALHGVGVQWREPPAVRPSNGNSNAKLVLSVDCDLSDLRERLIAGGVPMGPIKSYPPLTGPLCDGRDPEGNVFQLAQALQ